MLEINNTKDNSKASPRRIRGVAKGILARLIFGAQCLVNIKQVSDVSNSNFYWWLAIPVGLYIPEGAFTLYFKKEYKWFSPSVLIYLAGCIPTIWLLEYDMHDRRLAFLENSTKLALLEGKTSVRSEYELEYYNGPDFWTKVLEQTLFVALIIGRWLLPKGGLSREQLSELLLVYISMTADILELFEVFKEDRVRLDTKLINATLGLWTASMLQFTLKLTATRTNKNNIPEQDMSCFVWCFSTEVWGMIIGLVLQDIPFGVFRLLLILYFHIYSHGNVFFTTKNMFVICLQIYRLIVLHTERTKNLTEVEQDEEFNAFGIAAITGMAGIATIGAGNTDNVTTMTLGLQNMPAGWMNEPVLCENCAKTDEWRPDPVLEDLVAASFSKSMKRLQPRKRQREVDNESLNDETANDSIRILDETNETEDPKRR